MNAGEEMYDEIIIYKVNVLSHDYSIVRKPAGINDIMEDSGDFFDVIYKYCYSMLGQGFRDGFINIFSMVKLYDRLSIGNGVIDYTYQTVDNRWFRINIAKSSDFSEDSAEAFVIIENYDKQVEAERIGTERQLLQKRTERIAGLVLGIFDEIYYVYFETDKLLCVKKSDEVLSSVGKTDELPAAGTFNELFAGLVCPEDREGYLSLFSVENQRRNLTRPNQTIHRACRIRRESEYYWYDIMSQAVAFNEGIVSEAVYSIRNIHENKCSRDRLEEVKLREAKLQMENHIEERRLQLERQFMKVQSILFDAHRNKKSIIKALWYLVESVGAERAYIVRYSASRKNGEYMYEWFGDGALSVSGSDRYSVKIGEPIAIWNSGEDSPDTQTEEIRLSGDQVYGFLGVDKPKMKNIKELLRFSAISFSMAIDNIEEHVKIEQMGSIDFNTGVLNRNSYLNFISTYGIADEKCITCIFIDVNGLHDHNNSYGHASGDKMLKTIAEELSQKFAEYDVYRIGGDEFVIFGINCSEEKVYRRINEVRDNISMSDYYISVGIACWHRNDGHFDIDKLINRADKLMYEDKENYYKENRGNPRS